VDQLLERDTSAAEGEPIDLDRCRQQLFVPPPVMSPSRSMSPNDVMSVKFRPARTVFASKLNGSSGGARMFLPKDEVPPGKVTRMVQFSYTIPSPR
jgi:hypothetical protein